MFESGYVIDKKNIRLFISNIRIRSFRKLESVLELEVILEVHRARLMKVNGKANQQRLFYWTLNKRNVVSAMTNRERLKMRTLWVKESKALRKSWKKAGGSNKSIAQNEKSST